MSQKQSGTAMKLGTAMKPGTAMKLGTAMKPGTAMTFGMLEMNEVGQREIG
jgi:hypothetical protein